MSHGRPTARAAGWRALRGRGLFASSLLALLAHLPVPGGCGLPPAMLLPDALAVRTLAAPGAPARQSLDAEAVGLLVAMLAVVLLLGMLLSRRQLERRIVESEARHRRLVDESIFGVLVHRRYRPVYVNEAFARMLGYANAREVLGLASTEELYAPHERERMRAYQQARLRGEPAVSEYQFEALRKDGGIVVLNTVVQRTVWKGELATQHNVIDVTARVRAERALASKSAQLEAALENMEQGFAMFDAQLCLGAANENFYRLLDIPAQRFGAGAHLESLLRYDAERGELGEGNVEAMVRSWLASARRQEPMRLTRVRPDGTVLEIRSRPIPGGGLVATFSDITQQHHLSVRLSHEASHDALTNLLNRREFEQRLGALLEAAREDRRSHSLCYLDLDQFKVINDTCGHAAGDELLRQISGALRRHIRREDDIARLGGDEFGVLLYDCPLPRGREVAAQLRSVAEEFRFQWQGKTFRVAASIGLVPLDAHSGTVMDVMSAADSACFAAKDQGRNRIHVFSEDDQEVARRQTQVQWVMEIQDALEAGRFEFHLQPIVPVSPDRLDAPAHYELLLRMRLGDGSLVEPGVFLPAAERYHLMSRIDRFVVQHALQVLHDTPGLLASLGCCSINLSGQSLGDDDFLDFVLRQLDRTRVSPRKICFEITETAAIGNLQAASSLISTLKQIGCSFALDDFGSGLSSFAYLRSLPVDYLKIDGVFVKDIADDPIDRALVRSINEVARVMGKRTIAEFVESEDILMELRAIGVDYAQGLCVGPPVALGDIGFLRRVS